VLFFSGGRGKLTLFDKYSLLMRLESDENFKQIHASKMYNISPAAVNQMVKRKERIIRDYEFGLNPFSKRVSCLKNNMKILDERLMLFVIEKKREGQNVLANTQMIWDKAESIANELQLLENNGNGPNLWKPNRGWWFRFKNRVSSLVIPNFEMGTVDYHHNMMCTMDDRALDLPFHIESLQHYDFQLLDAANCANYLPISIDMPACKRVCTLDGYHNSCTLGDALLLLPDHIFDHEFALDSVDHAVATGVCPTETF
jgi:predicted DNA-binding protein YlxM (UPF0122 family)